MIIPKKGGDYICVVVDVVYDVFVRGFLLYVGVFYNKNIIFTLHLQKPANTIIEKYNPQKIK